MNKFNTEPTFTSIGIGRLRIAQDGTGITTLVAGYSCPLRCRYCLNPQCFQDATVTKTFSVEELLREVSRDDLYYRSTGGGITFGGGEPLLQADFIHAFAATCPADWNLSLETSLNVPRSLLDTVLADIDDYIIDCKDMDPVIYEHYTGKSPEQMLANLQYLVTQADPGRIHVRVPSIPGYNNEGNVRHSVDLLHGMGLTNIETFPYDTDAGARKLAPNNP